MSCLPYRIIVLAVFLVGLLSIQPVNVSASRNIDLRNSRVLKALQDLDVPRDIAPSPATAFDSMNESQKRRVRRGSDPIHNKC
ncbi:hypothetical protein Sango_1602700 [Sesamum angolense]|uniref:Uncharacterized protein n=1 Tax=Sesamum angolense TaxID=2727404 RepID=A0AAE1WJQ7_9LAMI|nr:hypothetical protein Sango_1602700 [Sesamum angolense]